MIDTSMRKLMDIVEYQTNDVSDIRPFPKLSPEQEKIASAFKHPVCSKEFVLNYLRTAQDGNQP